MTALNIAHRGASAEAPENTAAAFRLALVHGADMIETDLHLAQDGAVPLHHDPRLASREIALLTLPEIRERAPDVPMLEPTLDEFGTRIAFNLEIKRGLHQDYPGLAERALEAVRERNLLGTTLFSSFSSTYLERIRQLDPTARLGLLVSGADACGIDERAGRVQAESVHLPRLLAQRERIEQLQRDGLRVLVFTVDDPDEQRCLVEWGVDGLFTNRPAQLAQILRKQA